MQLQIALEAEQSSSFPSGVRVNYLKADLIKAYKKRRNIGDRDVKTNELLREILTPNTITPRSKPPGPEREL